MKNQSHSKSRRAILKGLASIPVLFLLTTLLPKHWAIRLKVQQPVRPALTVACIRVAQPHPVDAPYSRVKM